MNRTPSYRTTSYPRFRAAASLLTGAALFLSVTSGARAHDADPRFLGLPYFEGLGGADGGPDQFAVRLATVIERAGQLTSVEGETLLPAGTRLDQLTFDQANVAHMLLTFPVDAGFDSVQPDRLATIEHVLAGALMSRPDFAGVDIHQRTGDEPYRPLTELGPPPTPFVPDNTVSDDTGKTAAQAIRERLAAERAAAEPEGPEPLIGPVTNADGQPAGALSGVVVFCSAGHGWTANTSSWGLQRPVLLDMNEDYGNLEQLNYLVTYLYNAGAVVVPFRPVGYQTVEIVLDNDDPGVTFTGPWTNSTTTSGYYEDGDVLSGVPYRYATAGATETAVARYTPTIPAADFYPVYCWTKHDTDRVVQSYRIRHSGGTATVAIDHERVGRGWIWLGNFYFDAGTSGYVEITNLSPGAPASSVVIADAIRFGNGIGDVVGVGPNRVSGYPRDEEASRYWALSEAGLNAVGLPNVWECSGCNDNSDNVGTAARWAAEMNRNDVNNQRWRRAYIEYHSNAAGCGGGPPCTAKGTVALVTNTGATTNQAKMADVMGLRMETDMLAIDHLFEFTWGNRSHVYTSGFGAISTGSNNNEFDATILEVAFHDNPDDAANLRNALVRDALARTTLRGLIEFLSDPVTFPGTGVPAAYLPEPPQRVQAIHTAGGNVAVSWTAGLSGSPYGDAPTGYRIYRSTNGYGFGQALDVGNVTTHSLALPLDSVTYLRIAAYNPGGESLPSEVLAVRPSSAAQRVLLVNGYDRVSRQQSFIHTLPGGPIERPIAARVNAFDYVVQHAAALTASGIAFDACANESVIAHLVTLANYDAVVWVLGRESTADRTFDATEQSRVSAYLAGGGALFVSGSEIAYDLDFSNNGRTFFENTLSADYVADSSNTFNVTGSAGGIFASLGAFNFNPASGAPYSVTAADVLAPRGGALPALTYSGGSSGTAAVQYDSGVYRVLTLGFPFEVITSSGTRQQLMAAAMDYLIGPPVPPAGCPGSGHPITSFEEFPLSTQVVFRNPRYSGSTSGHLAASPDVALVTNAVPAATGAQSMQVQWGWIDTDPSRWMRLTTANAVGKPNPAVDLRRPIRLRLRLDSGQLRVCLGIRETGAVVAIGDNGGTSGTIDYLGASSLIDGAPRGVLVTAQPGIWQTLTFLPGQSPSAPFTGDGYIAAPNAFGVLEHIAFAIVDSAGPFTVYLDDIGQPCAPPADMDNDGDVDMDDYGLFQNCLTGPNVPQDDPACAAARLDEGSDVDLTDLDIFRGCMSGANLAADPDCVP